MPAHGLDPSGHHIRHKGDRHEAHQGADLGHVESGFTLTALPGLAADYPAPKEGSWVVRDFRFHTGEVLPELRLHYTTVGAPTGEPVLILHGTTGSGCRHAHPRVRRRALRPRAAAGRSRYYVILPDAIGTGKSSKPSDGLRTRFPKYNYDDMVDAQYRLVTEHLGVRHLRLVIGNSMGGMQTWIWAQKYPDFMDVAVPMASLPTEMSGRNWMMRRLIIDSIRNDPEWMNGNYTKQPRSAAVRLGVLRHRHQRRQPGTPQGGADAREGRPAARPAPERAVPRRCQRRPVPVGFVARLQPVGGPGAHPGDAAGDQLGRRRAQSAGTRGAGPRDQAREERPRAADPGSDQTAGHGTTAQARFWKQELAELLQSAPAAQSEGGSLGGQTKR